jgi:hypothetical protein
MNKSSILRRFRHGAIAIAGLVVSLVAIAAAAPEAFAMRVLPADGSGNTVTTAGNSGTPGWEIVLIVIGAVMLVSLLVGVVLRWRAPARLQRAIN